MIGKIKNLSLGLGYGLSVLFLGGFSATITQVGQEGFIKNLLPLFQAMNLNLSDKDLYLLAKKLGDWFALTLFVVVVLGALFYWVQGKKRYKKAEILILVIQGFVLLLGSQMLAYPIAFFFFLSAALTYLMLREARQRYRERLESETM